MIEYRLSRPDRFAWPFGIWFCLR